MGRLRYSFLVKTRPLLWTAACLLLASCHAGMATADPSEAKSGPVPADRRAAAPDLAGDSLDGKPLRLSDYRGKVVVINAWASWCGPCRAEAPELDAAQKHLAAEGVQVLGLNTDTEPVNGRSFQHDHHLTYPSFSDPSGRKVLTFPRGSVPQGVPFTVVVDARGRMANVHTGPVTERDVRDLVRPLVRS
ncbi:TlpA disulfide reductase family protein [Streptomyces sp. BK340]|uniref:TlpA family protein disulfide reductase n=1 Tax=Streptomyces sp. BK340 TaxID=2572903 RepID=UPI0011A960D1|nr:TlpA disulfide reductase family protein [Streptomyces sp. BK340]TVZ92509.1 peroxiredoxin [Streptomyces sp. BK340]